MGCRITKNDSLSPVHQQSTTGTSNEVTVMSRYTDSVVIDNNAINIDYKSRFERKMCLAKETPEPDFDLADCMLKEIPSGVFILCRVLRKENLYLNKNKLNTLKSGGLIDDLILLRTINLSENRIHRLPDDFSKLSNLRELIISHNCIDQLPITINKLVNLELCDVSHNKLIEINQINCMPHLRILNISGNNQLIRLPNQLSTCDSLIDLIFDLETVQYPPINILERGTNVILHYLTTGEISTLINATIHTENTDKMPIKILTSTSSCQLDENLEQKTKEKLLQEERLTLEKNVRLEAEMYNQNEKKKQELLRQLLQQQTENEQLVTKIQQEKDLERNRLIGDILNAEKNTNILVEKLLCLSNAPDLPILIEQERLQQEEHLAQLTIRHGDLRKQEILSAMSDILADETKTLKSYQQQKDATTKELLLKEYETSSALQRIFHDQDKDRTAVVVQIMHNEQLQKNAVASLIMKNDSRTWGLIEQVRIVELQLAALTHYEIERRKLCVNETISNLDEQRINLTVLLVDLIQQQEKRKQQLLDTLAGMEKQKHQEQHQDFWLLQYQRLWDSQPMDLRCKTATIDPLLGYQFLVNGVVHCLPFLSKLWQQKSINLPYNNNNNNITDADLRAAGINNISDRLNILKSIEEYNRNNNIITDQLKEPIAPIVIPSIVENVDRTLTIEDSSINTDNIEATMPRLHLETLAECVVCMEESCKIIFLPCGHLCCCFNCHKTLELCPMCRTQIERRIKVIQP